MGWLTGLATFVLGVFAAMPAYAAGRPLAVCIVPASIGRCTGPLRDETDWAALYRSADRALFDAKAAGRDRSHDATPSMANA